MSVNVRVWSIENETFTSDFKLPLELGSSCCGCFVSYNQTSVLMIQSELYEIHDSESINFNSNSKTFISARATIMFQANNLNKSWARLEDSAFSVASEIYCTGSFNKFSQFQVYTITKAVDDKIAALHSYNLPQNKWTKINDIDFTKIGPMEVIAGVLYTFSVRHENDYIGYYLDTKSEWIQLNHTKPKTAQTQKSGNAKQSRIFTIQYLPLPNRKLK